MLKFGRIVPFTTLLTGIILIIRNGKATEVFDDPFFIEEYDEENSEEEDRYNIVGFMKGIYITVSFTLRNDLIRIFSARKADSEEEEAYDENIRRYIGER